MGDEQLSSQKKPPVYIVGLPEDSAESYEAERKLEHLSADLYRVFPFIQHFRVVIKSTKHSAGRPRYEVSVDIYTPKEVHSFSETGYSLSTSVESLGPKMKRLLSLKQSKVTRTHGESPRKDES